MQQHFQHKSPVVRAFALLMGGLYVAVLLHSLIPHSHGEEHCEGEQHLHAILVAHHGHVHNHGNNQRHEHSHAQIVDHRHSLSDETPAESLQTAETEPQGWFATLSRTLLDLHIHPVVCLSSCTHLRGENLRTGAPLVIPAMYAALTTTELRAAPATDLKKFLPDISEYAQHIVVSDAPLRAPPISC